MDLLERSDHLTQLAARLLEVRQMRRGRLVLISGEAGGGKSALVREFCARHADVPTLTGACDALFTPRPLGPLLDIAAQTGGPLEALVQGEASPSEVVAALARTVNAPRIIVLEDLHWADEATFDVLRLLGRRVGMIPALVLATYREEELQRIHPLRMVLGELSSESIDRLDIAPLSADAVAQLAGDAADAAQLHRRTGGNAFFVTEVLAAASSDGAPGTVRDAVLARAARLSDGARRVLEAVAIVPPRAELWLLETLAGEDMAELDVCLNAGMLRVEDGGIAFRHEIARVAIADQLPPHRRVSLNRAALAALTGRVESARLAHHAEGADDGPAVLQHATTAAERAGSLGAHREAAALYMSALRHADGLVPSERAGLLRKRSYECFLTGQIPEAVEACTRALKEHRAAGDRLQEADSLLWTSRLAWFEGSGARAESAVGDALRLLQTLPVSPELAMGYSMRSALLMFKFDLTGTTEWGTRALDLAERLEKPAVLVHALGNIGTVELTHGRSGGLEKLERALAMAHDTGLPGEVARAYSNLGTSPLHRGDIDAAEPYLERGIAYCEEHDLGSWGSYMTGWSARTALDRGDWDRAHKIASGVLERTPVTLPISRFIALIVVGLLRARRGEKGVWGPLDEAYRTALGTEELERLVPATVARAEAHWLAGEQNRVIEETEPVLALARTQAHEWSVAQLTLWRARSGVTPEDPHTLLSPFREELSGGAVRAARDWQERGRTYEAAVALASSDSEADLRSSLATLLELDARSAATLVARRLRARGAGKVQAVPRAPKQANPAGLTARQMQVLELIVQGDRNADIAAKLFLSEKTVSHHVSGILGKLDVRTRVQAAAEAARLGIIDQKWGVLP